MIFLKLFWIHSFLPYNSPGAGAGAGAETSYFFRLRLRLQPKRPAPGGSGSVSETLLLTRLIILLAGQVLYTTVVVFKWTAYQFWTRSLRHDWIYSFFGFLVNNPKSKNRILAKVTFLILKVLRFFGTRRGHFIYQYYCFALSHLHYIF